MDRSTINRATSSDDSPTPGYLFGEIAGMTLSSYEACVQLEDYLLKRLQKNDSNIKYKALNVIKHTVREGRPEFKRNMGKHVNEIKACLEFRGPPDPLRGDEPYRKVRHAARETLDAIFESSAPQTSNSSALNATKTRIQGFGSDPLPSSELPHERHMSSSRFMHSSPSPPSMADSGNSPRTSSYRGSGMEGIGNPNFAISEEPSFLERAQNLAREGMNMISEKLQSHPEGQTSYPSSSSSSSSSFSSPPSSFNPSNTFHSNRGGGQYDITRNSYNNSSFGGGGFSQN
jgi:hypothetical protein